MILPIIAPIVEPILWLLDRYQPDRFWFLDEAKQRYRSVRTDVTLERIKSSELMKDAKQLLAYDDDELKLLGMQICHDETQKIFGVKGLDMDQSSRLLEEFADYVQKLQRKFKKWN